MLFQGYSFTAASGAAAGGAPAEQTECLEAKTHCSNTGCVGAGTQECTGCKRARYCGQACQLASGSLASSQEIMQGAARQGLC
jgi:hypothetical protein